VSIVEEVALVGGVVLFVGGVLLTGGTVLFTGGTVLFAGGTVLFAGSFVLFGFVLLLGWVTFVAFFAIVKVLLIFFSNSVRFLSTIGAVLGVVGLFTTLLKNYKLRLLK
jgi:hypothetical protein